MTKLRHIVSATIVVFLWITTLVILMPINVYAAPLDEVPASQSPSQSRSEVSDTNTSTKSTDENMAITQPDTKVASSSRGDSHYYSHRQTFTFRAGAAAPVDDFVSSESIFGFAFMFPKFLSPRFEAGADIHNDDDKGHVHAGMRKIYFERGRVRPSYKYGLSHEVHANEGIASFGNIDHYFGRGSAAVDISYDQNWALRFEIEVLVGIEKQWLVGSLGLSRCW